MSDLLECALCGEDGFVIDPMDESRGTCCLCNRTLVLTLPESQDLTNEGVADMADHKQFEQIERAFTYHPPQGDQAERYDRLRRAAKDLANGIVTLTPASREQSLALTNLEQAIMWANAAIARNEEPYSEPK